MTTAIAEKERGKLHVVGEPPWFANIAKVMDPAPELLDQLVAEFAPQAAGPASKDSYWLALHMWMVNHVVGPVMTGEVGAKDLRRKMWPLYATGYWGCLETQQL